MANSAKQIEMEELKIANVFHSNARKNNKARVRQFGACNIAE